MTVIGLIWKLTWIILSGRARPGDPVVREFGASEGYINVVYCDSLMFSEHDTPVGEGVDHRMFSRYGTGNSDWVRVLKLD